MYVLIRLKYLSPYMLRIESLGLFGLFTSCVYLLMYLLSTRLDDISTGHVCLSKDDVYAL